MVPASVMLSAPVPPMRVSTFVTVAVLLALAKLSVSTPAPRSMEAPAAAVSKGDGVGAGAADQGRDVADGPVLPPAARVSLLAPQPRSTEHAVVSAVPSVTVSLPVPPVRVSTLATVAELVPLASVSVSLPAPRSMRAVGDGGGEGDGVVACAADQGADVADGAGVAAGGERQLVGAGAEIDGHGGGQRGGRG